MKITLMGMYDYMQAASDDLFQSLNFEGIDKTNLTNNILMVCGEYPVLWSNPYFVKNMIGVWCQKMLPTVNKWVSAFAIEYNPLHNYDRNETFTDVTTDSKDTAYSHSGTVSGTNTNTSTNSVTAYNSNTFAPSDKNDGSSTDSTTSTINDSTDEDRNLRTTHTARMYGNIGVTTSQQMLVSELNLAADYNIYDMITDAFKHEFCLMIF